MSEIYATRYHDISCGHRVVGHESKCRFLHGHNYRITFVIRGRNGLDNIGRVIDFSVIKSILCEWLEENWDHKFLLWESDPILPGLREVANIGLKAVPFNPTAENMGRYLVHDIGPSLLPKDVVLVKVVVEETRKCSAEVTL